MTKNTLNTSIRFWQNCETIRENCAKMARMRDRFHLPTMATYYGNVGVGGTKQSLFLKIRDPGVQGLTG